MQFNQGDPIMATVKRTVEQVVKQDGTITLRRFENDEQKMPFHGLDEQEAKEATILWIKHAE